MQAGNGRQRRGSLSGAHLLAEAEVLPATHYARHEAMLPTDLVALHAAAVAAAKLNESQNKRRRRCNSSSEKNREKLLHVSSK